MNHAGETIVSRIDGSFLSIPRSAGGPVTVSPAQREIVVSVVHKTLGAVFKRYAVGDGKQDGEPALLT